jgi:single-stranded-DNA-specific exonuclease
MGLSINLKKYLDLVALGTIADVVPLQGINRILARAGLEVLSARHRIGVFSICDFSGINSRDILSEDVSFRLAPRINAAGRLGCPMVGVELLLAENAESARVVAGRLEKMNQDRKQLEIAAIHTMEAEYQEQFEACNSGFTLYQAECHAGVLGILASRFVDRCQRPVIVFSDERKNGGGDFLRGSGRSVPGINLFQVLEECTPLLKQFGGHAMAVGLTIRKEQLSRFKELFNAKVKRMVEQIPGSAHATIDYYLPGAHLLSASFAHALQRMQPFGEGNPEPVLFLARQQLLSARARNGHLMFQLQGAGEVLPGIGFNLGVHDLNFSLPANLTFHLKRSWFRGSERIQVQALSIATT